MRITGVARLAELELLDEKCIHNLKHLKVYQNKVSIKYNKRIIPRQFEVGDLVMKENQFNTRAEWEKKGKFEPHWLGPYVVVAKYGTGE